MNKIDKYLVVLFATLAVFVIAMVIIFTKYLAIPDTLVVSVFGIAGGECGVLGFIKSAKERSKRKKGDDDDEAVG